MQSTTHKRQSLADKVIEQCGSIESIFAVADRNDIAITDDLAAGSNVSIGNGEVAKRQVVIRLNSYAVKPATAIIQAEADKCPYGGIGYMGIEYDFTVK